MKSRDFAFYPGQYVIITLFGLEYRGRVLRCIWDEPMNLCDVNYADDKGDIKRAEFLEDELKGVSPLRDPTSTHYVDPDLPPSHKREMR